MLTCARPSRLLLPIALVCLCAWTPLRGDLRDSARAPNHHYEQIVIVAPQNRATVFDQAGDVEVAILISPVLAPVDDDRIELYLDGQPAPSATPLPTGFALNNVERGGHWLQARIANRAGLTVIASKPVQFFMWQDSRRFSPAA